MLTYPRAGSYGVVKTGGFFALVVRILCRSRFDHAFIVIDDLGGIIEAEPTGARTNNIGVYAGLPMLINSGETLTDQQRALVADAARHYLGTPYAFLDIVRLALASLGIRWRWLTAEADDENAMVCSTLVAATGVKAGLDTWLCGEPSPALVRPADLAKRDCMQPWPTSTV